MDRVHDGTARLTSMMIGALGNVGAELGRMETVPESCSSSTSSSISLPQPHPPQNFLAERTWVASAANLRQTSPLPGGCRERDTERERESAPHRWSEVASTVTCTMPRTSPWKAERHFTVLGSWLVGSPLPCPPVSVLNISGQEQA
jgi:hypothetical protein